MNLYAKNIVFFIVGGFLQDDSVLPYQKYNITDDKNVTIYHSKKYHFSLIIFFQYKITI